MEISIIQKQIERLLETNATTAGIEPTTTTMTTAGSQIEENNEKVIKYYDSFRTELDDITKEVYIYTWAYTYMYIYIYIYVYMLRCYF